jgi:hypothetical protein
MTVEVSRLVDVINNGIESKLIDLHTAMPATVVSFDASSQTVSVQPTFKRVYNDGTVQLLPIINNVPVVFPSADGGSAILSMPVKAGDHVLLVFAQRALDQWLEKGSPQDPIDPRKFNLTDAICIPGMFPKTKKSARVSTNSVRLEYQGAKIELFPDGKVTVGDGTAQFEITSSGKIKIGVGGTDLLQLLSDTLQAISVLTVTCAAPASPSSPPINVASFTALKSQVDSIKG